MAQFYRLSRRDFLRASGLTAASMAFAACAPAQVNVEAPVANALPPDEAAYHFTVFDDVAFRVTVPLPQRLAPVVTGEGGSELIVAVEEDPVLKQPLSENA